MSERSELAKLPTYAARAVQVGLALLVVYYWMLAEASRNAIEIQATGIRAVTTLAVILTLEIVVVRATAGWRA